MSSHDLVWCLPRWRPSAPTMCENRPTSNNQGLGWHARANRILLGFGGDRCLYSNLLGVNHLALQKNTVVAHAKKKKYLRATTLLSYFQIVRLNMQALKKYFVICRSTSTSCVVSNCIPSSNSSGTSITTTKKSEMAKIWWIDFYTWSRFINYFVKKSAPTRIRLCESFRR